MRCHRCCGPATLARRQQDCWAAHAVGKLMVRVDVASPEYRHLVDARAELTSEFQQQDSLEVVGLSGLRPGRRVLLRPAVAVELAFQPRMDLAEPVIRRCPARCRPSGSLPGCTR